MPCALHFKEDIAYGVVRLLDSLDGIHLEAIDALGIFLKRECLALLRLYMLNYFTVDEKCLRCETFNR